MSLREQQQMKLDSESAAHTGMEGQSRSAHKYLLLQVWCGILTVAMVVMAARLASIRPKWTEDGGSTSKLGHVSPTGTSPSCIQLIKSLNGRAWEESPGCHSCALVLRNNSIYCTKDSLYFLYAQVTFRRPPNTNRSKSVILKKNAANFTAERKLVEGRFPKTTEGSVWVAKIVTLREGDSVSLDIPAGVLHDNTYWGAYQLQ